MKRDRSAAIAVGYSSRAESGRCTGGEINKIMVNGCWPFGPFALT